MSDLSICPYRRAVGLAGTDFGQVVGKDRGRRSDREKGL